MPALYYYQPKIGTCVSTGLELASYLCPDELNPAQTTAAAKTGSKAKPSLSPPTGGKAQPTKTKSTQKR